MKSEKPVRDMDSILVRVPDGMKEQILQRARANGRSMSAEVVSILTELFELPDEMGLRALMTKREELSEREQKLKSELRDIQSQLSYVLAELERRLMQIDGNK